MGCLYERMPSLARWLPEKTQPLQGRAALSLADGSSHPVVTPALLWDIIPQRADTQGLLQERLRPPGLPLHHEGAQQTSQA